MSEPSDAAVVPSVKTFVLDTNVLLHNPGSLYLFEDNEVVVPFAVLEELDKFKKQNDDVGRNARDVIRRLDALRVQGRLAEGVVWNESGGTIRVAFDRDPASAPRHPGRDGREQAGGWLGAARHHLDGEKPDDRILGAAWRLQEEGRWAVLITKDINVRLKSDALGIATEDFEAQKVDVTQLYSGAIELAIPGEQINTLYQEKQLDLTEVMEAREEDPGSGTEMPERAPFEIHANEFVQLKNVLDPSHAGLARRLADTEHLIPILRPRKPVHGVMARNVQQTMALDLLLDDEVQLVTLLGAAGTGKTLLALAAGMAKVFLEERYDKLLTARPIMPMGRDIGYLPGDKEEKLTAWMQPIFDNLTYLMSTRSAGSQHAESKNPEQRIERLMSSGALVLEPLTYIRGRSIPHQFMMIDEAQNLTPHEVKTIVSRVGEGTKIVLTGDIAQIDNPYLDSSSNGLSYMVERLKGQPMVGHVTLTRSERSELASLAAERL